MENKRRGKYWIGFAFLALVGCIALLPTIASTEWGFKQISKFIPGKISAKSAHLSWLGSQNITGFRYKGPQATFTFKEFSTDSSLVTLILTRRAADTKLIDPKLVLELSEPKRHKALFLPFKGGATIENGTINLKRNQVSVAEFQDIDIHLNVDENALPITLEATGKTSSGSNLGRFKIQGQIDHDTASSDLSKWITGKLGLPQNSHLRYTLHANLQNFPLAGFYSEAFGPMLTLQTDFLASAQDNTLSLSAHSKQLSADIRAIAPNEDIEIAAGSALSLQITPKFWQTFQTDLKLLQPIKADMRILNVNIPINNWQALNGKAQANFTDGLLNHAKMPEPIAISHAKLNLKTQNLSQALDIGLTSNFGSSGKLSGSLTWPKPLSESPSVYTLLTKLKLAATNFPTVLIGLSDELGEMLNFSIESENDILDLSATSRKLNAKELEFKITPQALQLIRQATIRYTLDHPLFASQTPVNIQLTKLYLPKQIQTMRFQGNVTATQATLTPLPKYGQIQLTDSSLSINAKSLNDASFSFLSRMGFIGADGLLKELLGPALNLSGNGKADLQAQTASLHLVAIGKSSELNINAAIEDKTVALTKPIELKTILTRKAFNLLKPEALAHLKLTKNAPVYIELEPFKLKFPELDWENALKANLNARALSLKSHIPFTITDFDTSIALSTETTAIESSGNIDNGSYDLNLIVKKLDQTLEKADLDCQNISSAIVDSLLNQQQTLTNALGSTFDIHLDIDPNRYKIDLTSPKLNLNGTFKINNRITSIGGPVTVTYLLTQQTIENFVSNPSKINLKIDAFQAPLKTRPTLQTQIPVIDWNWNQILIDARAHSDEIIFSQNKTLAALHNFDLRIDRSSLSEPLDFELDSTVSMQKNKKAKQRTGSIQLSGTLSDFYDNKGHFSTQNLSTEIAGQIKHLPSIFLDTFIPNASALFGDSLNASISAQIHNMNGTLACDVRSPHTTFKLDSYISNGILHLRAPLDAAFTLTPALSNLFLADANLTALSAQKPIRLYIDSKNVSIPLRNFNWQNVRIGAARLDFGKIIVASQGSAADLIEIFKIRRPNQVTLWFAPLDFRIKNGKMDIQRTEILYDAAYQIAIWGRINFPRRYVDMTLGLTAQSLYRALGLRVPANYVLTIDVEGPFGNVHIDKGDAIAKIALIIAEQSGLAPQQGIAGGVFDIIQGFAHDQSNVPPPRPPFPWSH